MKEIKLTGARGIGKFVLVDDEDHALLSRMTWNLSKKGYVVHDHVYIHQIVMGFSDKMIDHINRNPLDNRKENLRLVYHLQNLWNKGKRIDKKFSSKYKGVHWNKVNKCWTAQISYNDHTIALGNFKEERHAAMVYDLWALEFHGEFAYTNFKIIKSS